ncbi:DUF4235 domain-containing protein [Streptomyces tsukubensis]|uniref:DUF4235 domain-containing protein n=1 Tax=Streptomyces tsukubensis TaxID=83656 RepID=A0A1V4A382_9ACTN|nr:DUF4235 domain-containing protein [Streptomyces tsukubensis]OON74740.1 hypothetical protein B1H18_24900 [Streptomyces tsukubensis]QFR92988.1 DUF4235 domain-containing protein [Streptomyces tsukubensis]
MNRAQVLYKPVGLATGMLGGMLATAVFKRTWKAVTGEGDAPDAMDKDRSWGEILATAAVQGAIFSTVKAAVDRGGAVTVRRLTGTWPD